MSIFVDENIFSKASVSSTNILPVEEPKNNLIPATLRGLVFNNSSKLVFVPPIIKE